VAAAELDLIRLVAPTTTDERLAAAVSGAGGFIYLISRLGVTGARPDAPPDLDRHVRRLRGVTRLPIAIGFGISTPAHAAAAARWADGVVVGSALVDALEHGGLDAARRLLESLAGALATQGAA
jgi:tryptophan synthase alpha chain